MVSADEALQLISQYLRITDSETVKVNSSEGRILAEDIYSPSYFPQFDNSAVDGFLVKTEWFSDNSSLKRKIAGIIAAGDSLTLPSISASAGITARIMTGAMVPSDFDAIVMQEQVEVEGDHAVFSQKVKTGQNIRLRGEDVDCGQKVLSKGDRISSGRLGLLLALGISEIRIRKSPTVAIISTGSELVEAGQPLKYGQVYYCTGPMLAAQIEQFGGSVVSVKQVADDLQATVQALNDQAHADIVLLVGGMSVGRFDFGRTALAQSGVQEIFYLGKWRPGKPLYFGQRGNQRIFGLPGNPVSCFVMNSVFVQSLLRGTQGQSIELPWKWGRTRAEFTHQHGPVLFLRAQVDEEGVIDILSGQGSHQLGTLSQANALCFVPEAPTTLNVNASIKYMSL